MTNRVYNFSAGPSTLPLAVLEQAQEELPAWKQSGMSVMEMTHRGKDFINIASTAEHRLRQLLAVPAAYHILFLQGGASAQFSAIPLNLLAEGQKAAYVDTGIWSQKAIEEAREINEVVIAASSQHIAYRDIPSDEAWQIPQDVGYLHYTANETIGGLEFHAIPDSHGLPLVGDLSSTILSRPLDVSQFGLIYAGAQKNMGPAGITVVIIRDDLLGDARKGTPSILNYRKQAANQSMINTPPTYPWYLLGLVLAWLEEQGGLAAIDAINHRKAAKLYDFIDRSELFANPIAVGARSRMNVPFTLGEAALEKDFIAFARSEGLVNLEGHRSVGGCRASIYNAMPESGVDALIQCMAEFERQRG